jgi:hypothetical protein
MRAEDSDLAPDVENTIFHQIATSLIGFQALEMGFLLMVQDLSKTPVKFLDLKPALPTSWGKLYNELQSSSRWVTARSRSSWFFAKITAVSNPPYEI